MPVYDSIPCLMPVLVVANCDVARSVAFEQYPELVYSSALLACFAPVIIVIMCPRHNSHPLFPICCTKKRSTRKCNKAIKMSSSVCDSFAVPGPFYSQTDHRSSAYNTLSVHCAPHKAQCIHFHFILAHSLYPLQSPASTSNRFSSTLSSHSPLPIRLTLYKFAVKGIRR